MEKFSNSDIKFGIGGWIFGSLGFVNLLADSTITILGFVVKFVALILSGLIAGFFTVLGTDLYKLKVKPWLFKNKQNGKRNDNEEKAA